MPARAARRGPIEGVYLIGLDADPSRRPGVPMERLPPRDPAPDRPLIAQGHDDDPLIRTGLAEPTPVFGTAQPPHGVSGVLRRLAYQTPEHLARHWMLLLCADRLDVAESRLGNVMARPLESQGWNGAAAVARLHPLPVLGGLVLAAWGLRRLL